MLAQLEKSERPPDDFVASRRRAKENRRLNRVVEKPVQRARAGRKLCAFSDAVTSAEAQAPDAHK